MEDNEPQMGDLSLSASDFLIWRVARAKQQCQDDHKKQIVQARPRLRRAQPPAPH